MNRNHVNIGTSTMWIAVLALAGLLLPTRAEVIADYEFVNLTSSDAEPNTTASDFDIVFAHSAGRTNTAGGTVYAMADAVDGTPTDPGDEAGAIGLGNYFSFTVEPASGYQIDLTTLSFDILFDADPTDDPTPEATWFVKSSIGGFGATDPTLGSRNAPVSLVDSDIATIDPLIDMSGLPTQTSLTEFRLYIYDNNIGGSTPHRLDNVTLSGDVTVIPEPATLWMVALGLVAVVASRRRASA